MSKQRLKHSDIYQNVVRKWKIYLKPSVWFLGQSKRVQCRSQCSLFSLIFQLLHNNSFLFCFQTNICAVLSLSQKTEVIRALTYPKQWVLFLFQSKLHFPDSHWLSPSPKTHKTFRITVMRHSQIIQEMKKVWTCRTSFMMSRFIFFYSR